MNFESAVGDGSKSGFLKIPLPAEALQLYPKTPSESGYKSVNPLL